MIQIPASAVPPRRILLATHLSSRVEREFDPSRWFDAAFDSSANSRSKGD